jgi:uncharacterized protein
VPYWTSAAEARLNGDLLERAALPGSYLTVDRRWRDGDQLTVRLPMHLHLAHMPDDPTLQAAMYGPLVLAGRLGTAGLTAANLRAGPTPPRKVPEYPAQPVAAPVISARPGDPASWLTPVAGRVLEFRTTADKRPIAVVPLNGIFDERYAVYWKVSEAAAAQAEGADT